MGVNRSEKRTARDRVREAGKMREGERTEEGQVYRKDSLPDRKKHKSSHARKM